MVSMLLTPWIKDCFNQHFGHGLGWHAAFSVCCVGLSLSNYFAIRHTLDHIGSEPDCQSFWMPKLSALLAVGVAVVFLSAFILNFELVAKLFVYAVAVVVLGIFAYLIARNQPSEGAGLIVAPCCSSFSTSRYPHR